MDGLITKKLEEVRKLFSRTSDERSHIISKPFPPATAMSSVMSSEGSKPSNLLQVPNGRSMTNGEARVLKRLANSGKNDSIKSTYSLSVFLDPDASKDMVRHEELWYPMDEPCSADNQGLDGMNQGPPPTGTFSAASASAGSRNSGDGLMLTHEKREQQLTSASNQTANYGQNKEVMRRGSGSTTSSTGASRSLHKETWSGNESGTDMENHFNRNTVVLGIQSGEGRGGGGGRGRGGGGGGGRGGGEGGGTWEGRTEARAEAGLREGFGYGEGERRGEGGARSGHTEERAETGTREYLEYEEGGRRGGGSGEGGRGGERGGYAEQRAGTGTRYDIGYEEVGRRGGGGSDRREDTKQRAGIGTREDLGHGVRRWSTEGNLQRVSYTQDTDDDEYGEEVVEQEEILQVRSHIGALSKVSPSGRGVSTSSDSAAEEDAVGYLTGIEERSDFRHALNASDAAADKYGDGYSSGTQARQSAAKLLETQDSSTEEEEEDASGHQIITHGRKSFGERIREASSGSNSAADDAVKYNSAMQPRTSCDQSSRNRSGQNSFTDVDRSLNPVNYVGSRTQMTAQKINASDEDDTLTEGSDEEEIAQTYHREPIQPRPRLSRTMQVDGGYREIDSQVYQNGGTGVTTSAPRNSSAVHSEGELGRDYQGRRHAFGLGREGSQRAVAQSEDEIGRLGKSSFLTHRGEPIIRRPGQEESSMDDINNRNYPGGTLNRRNDPNTQTTKAQGRTQEGSSEGEVEGLRHNGRQATPVVRVTTLSSSSYTGPGGASRQLTSDDDVAKVNVRNDRPLQGVPSSRGRDPAFNGVRDAPGESQSLTSEEEERVNGSGVRRNMRGWASNSTKPRDANQYQPHPAERKTLTPADSLSSNGYSSPREPYSPGNYLPRAAYNRGRRSADTDSVSASDDSRTLNHRANGNAPTRRADRDKGSSARHAISPDVQPRSGGTLPNDRYSGSSPSNLLHHSPQQRRPSANQTMGYSDGSDVDDDDDTRSHQQFVLDFPSETEDRDGTGNSTRKTTVRKTTTTPVTGVLRVTPQPPSSEIVREKTTKTVMTTPVFGVVSIPEAEPKRDAVVAPPVRNRTPVIGRISVSRSPSPERIERTKTPIVGLISVPQPQSQSVVVTTRTHHPMTGEISVSNSNQIAQRRSATPSAQLIPDVNNNINAYPGKFRRTDLASSVIETLALPGPDTQAEIVGIDPELRRARKTWSNQYRITMNLRPVVGDSSELGYEGYNTAFGRATPIPMDRLRVNGSRADWRYSDGSEGGSYYRPPSAPISTLRSRQSGARTPSSQLGFVARRSGHEDSPVSRLNSMSYSTSSHRRIASPVRRQAYDIPPRRSSVGAIDGSRQYLRNTVHQVQPILQTVTSRPRRLSSDTEHPGYNPYFLGVGERGRQKRLSSTMSSVFLSPTVERRSNVAASRGPPSFRDDTFYRY